MAPRALAAAWRRQPRGSEDAAGGAAASTGGRDGPSLRQHEPPRGASCSASACGMAGAGRGRRSEPPGADARGRAAERPHRAEKVRKGGGAAQATRRLGILIDLYETGSATHRSISARRAAAAELLLLFSLLVKGDFCTRPTQASLYSARLRHARSHAPDSAKLLHKAFINHRQGLIKKLLPARNALWRWVGRASHASVSTAVMPDACLPGSGLCNAPRHSDAPRCGCLVAAAKG